MSCITKKSPESKASIARQEPPVMSLVAPIITHGDARCGEQIHTQGGETGIRSRSGPRHPRRAREELRALRYWRGSGSCSDGVHLRW